MIHGVHGLWAKLNKTHMSKLIRLLRKDGYPCEEFNYNFTCVIDTFLRLLEISNANRLLLKVKSGDSIAAHSYGCAITWRMLESLGEYNEDHSDHPLFLKNIYLFNAALDAEIKFDTRYVKNIYVFYDKRDWLIHLANLIPDNIMGAMGKKGALRPDPKVHNIEITENNVNIISSHFTVFNNHENLRKYCDFIEQREQE